MFTLASPQGSINLRARSSNCSWTDAQAVWKHQVLKKPHRWMREVLNLKCGHMMHRRLVDMTLVGAHDAGAWWLSKRKASCGLQCHGCRLLGKLGNDAPVKWGVAQRGAIGSQLEAGARYFDFRLTFDKKQECNHMNFGDRGCWVFWHCLVGHSIEHGVGDLRKFLLDDARDPKGQGEIIIIAMKIEHYGHGSTKSTRMLALLRYIDEQLGEFVFDLPGPWWMRQLGTIVNSGKRLVLVMYVGKATITIGEFRRISDTVNVTNRYTSAKKCDYSKSKIGQCFTDEHGQVPFWGRYSNTCCKIDKVSTHQRFMRNRFMDIYLSGKTTVDKLRLSQELRPMFMLYWTMTYSPTSQLKTRDGGNIFSLAGAASEVNSGLEAFFRSSRGVPMFANVIMADFIADTSAILKVAVHASVVDRISTDANRQQENASTSVVEPFGTIIVITVFLLGICCCISVVVYGRQWKRNRTKSLFTVLPSDGRPSVEISRSVHVNRTTQFGSFTTAQVASEPRRWFTVQLNHQEACRDLGFAKSDGRARPARTLDSRHQFAAASVNFTVQPNASEVQANWASDGHAANIQRPSDQHRHKNEMAFWASRSDMSRRTFWPTTELSRVTR